jgi:hypothetical protein
LTKFGCHVPPNKVVTRRRRTIFILKIKYQ